VEIGFAGDRVEHLLALRAERLDPARHSTPLAAACHVEQCGEL